MNGNYNIRAIQHRVLKFCVGTEQNKHMFDEGNTSIKYTITTGHAVA
jgi:hypothetical protein